jgi:hypothetical protein
VCGFAKRQIQIQKVRGDVECRLVAAGCALPPIIVRQCQQALPGVVVRERLVFRKRSARAQDRILSGRTAGPLLS